MMPASIATPVPSGPPRNLLWTVDQFHYLGGLGMFEGRWVMLIDGVLYEEGRETPVHGTVRHLAADALRPLFSGVGFDRQRMSLVLGSRSDPNPDVTVVPGRIRDYSKAHPTTALIVVEVADYSLSFDTTVKAELYATANIPDYWVVDVENRRLLVYRDPEPLPAGLGATAYRTHLALGPADSVSPLAVPGATIAVADLLP